MQDKAMESALEAGFVRNISKTSKKKGDEIIKIQFLPAKTEMDSLYGFFGENCLSSYPEEIQEPDFTPERMVVDERINGALHTITHEFRAAPILEDSGTPLPQLIGAKALILPGTEPKESLVVRINAREFVIKMLDKCETETAVKNDYDIICLPLNGDSLSNRPEIKDALKKELEKRTICVIEQDERPCFPKDYGTPEEGNMRKLAVIWVNPKSGITLPKKMLQKE